MSLLGHQASLAFVPEAFVFCSTWAAPPLALIIHTLGIPFWSLIKATRWPSGDQAGLAVMACSKNVSWTGSPPVIDLLKMFASSGLGPRANAIQRPSGEKLGSPKYEVPDVRRLISGFALFSAVGRSTRHRFEL